MLAQAPSNRLWSLWNGGPDFDFDFGFDRAFYPLLTLSRDFFRAVASVSSCPKTAHRGGSGEDSEEARLGDQSRYQRARRLRCGSRCYTGAARATSDDAKALV